MLFSAMISTVLGMLSGVLPSLVQLWKDERAAKNERALMELTVRSQIELAKVTQSTRMGEIAGNEAVAHIQASKEQLLAAIGAQIAPTGIQWVDALNASLRPVCAYTMLALFAALVVAYSAVVLCQFWMNELDADTVQKVLFGGLFGEGVGATYGFVFGYRSTKVGAK